MSDIQLNKILSELESGYDQMADKFSQTRKFFWRDFEFIADYVEDGDKILDYGCGNGRLLEILGDKNIEYTGVDASQKLIDLAKKKYPQFSQNFHKISSSNSLPLQDNYFNKIISIAVFHHFPEKYAEEMAKELFRIMKTQGKIIVTVWNLEQERFEGYMKKGSRDLYIPFRDNEGRVFERYHRLYTKKDLENIFSKAGFSIEKSDILNERNIIIVGKK
jgi:alkylated DNA repair protein alkB family protein 8